MSARCALVVGEVFGRLTVLSEAEPAARWRRRLLCLCECGERSTAYRDNLVKGTTQSCGCLKIERCRDVGRSVFTHRLSKTLEYNTWIGMLHRCQNPKNNKYKDYGGRGITVDPRWFDFESFLLDMGVRPSKKFSLERKNNDAGYFLDNCIWANATTQSNNQRRTIRVTLHGEKTTLAIACRKLGVNRGTVYTRIKEGWPEKDWFKPARSVRQPKETK